MSKRLRISIFVILIFILFDGWAWWMTYKIHTALPPEQLEVEAELSATFETSSVKPEEDNYHQIVRLNGVWQYKQTGSGIGDYTSIEKDTRDWHTMEIPQNWYLAGLNYHGVVWFQKDFYSDSDWRGRLVQLRFDGVDYYADVWLNGNKIGEHDGYFQPFLFDLTNQLNYEGENILVVRVESPYEEYKTAWPFRKTLIKGIFAHSSSRPGDPWGPTGQEYNTGGIWNNVSLVISDFLTINDVQITAIWPTSTTIGIDPTVNATIILENHADITLNADIQLEFIPKNHTGQSITLPKTSLSLPRGSQSFSLSGLIKNPILWWTWDRGDPNLYTARVEITSKGKILADKELTFGFRQINITDRWYWYLNGERFFPRGSNYISSQWLSQTNHEWIIRDIYLIKDANLNFVRLPAHVEPDEFYGIMDEEGILIWQDFSLQWGYSDAPAFIDEAQNQLEDMIRLLNNHPSIVVWCIHNEGPSDMPWLGEKDENYSPSQNRRLDTVLYNLAMELDPTRYIHKNSGQGDNHVYVGWNSGQWLNYGDWSGVRNTTAALEGQPPEQEFNLPGAPFITEFGAQALPNLELLSTIFLPAELTYASGEIRDRWEFHNFQPKETFNIAQIEPGESIEDFVQASQSYQANLIQFATETYRRAKYNPMQGIFYAQMIDSWPSIGYSVVDYNRQPKMGYYTLQTAMQPILPSICPSKPSGLDGSYWTYSTVDDFWASLWIINDTMDVYHGAILNWRIENKTGQNATFGQIKLDIPSDSSERVWTISSARITEGSYRLFVSLSTENGELLGENSFLFTILPVTEDIEE